MSDTTTIQISNETWQGLNGLKQGPNETFDDVLQRLLDRRVPDAVLEQLEEQYGEDKNVEELLVRLLEETESEEGV